MILFNKGRKLDPKTYRLSFKNRLNLFRTIKKLKFYMKKLRLSMG